MSKIGKKVAVMLVAFVMVFNLTAQFASADKISHIPTKYQGMYRHPTEPGYLISISGAYTAVFKGKMYGYGLSAASQASVIVFDPDVVYWDNFSILFEKRAVYDPNTQCFEPVTGELLLSGKYYHNLKAIEINEETTKYATYTKQ